MLAFHAPDHSLLYMESSYVIAIRPDGHNRFAHLPKTAKAVVYGPTRDYAIVETADEVKKMIEDCKNAPVDKSR
jgi:hypothetical protein